MEPFSVKFLEKSSLCSWFPNVNEHSRKMILFFSLKVWFQNRRAKWRKSSEKGKKGKSTPSSTPSTPTTPTTPTSTNKPADDIAKDRTSPSSDCLKSEQANIAEDISKFNAAPRLTHPPYSFPTYQGGSYCPNTYSNLESRGISNGVSYPLSVENLKDSYVNRGGGIVPVNGDQLDWRAWQNCTFNTCFIFYHSFHEPIQDIFNKNFSIADIIFIRVSCSHVGERKSCVVYSFHRYSILDFLEIFVFTSVPSLIYQNDISM